jgi:uncharacterized protein YjbI with pentapeptide repeats
MERRVTCGAFIVDSLLVGYDGGQHVRDEEHRVDQDQQSRWQMAERWVLWICCTALASALMLSLYGGYHAEWKWVGLVKNPDFPKRTLWDWLKLLVVPAVLALGGYLFTRSENRRTQDIADQQRDLDREIADERRQDDTLQAYLDGISQLLTDKDRPLHRTQPGDSLSTVARARTLTVLPILDGGRRTSVLRFLLESGLIYKGHNIVSLNQANLGEADLPGANLRKADLSGAYLGRANLSEAKLSEAKLSGANLREADLREADLNVANLNRANLVRAKLNCATLTYAIISSADVSSADLRNADLRNAHMGWTKLSEADLCGANLRKADLSGADLSGATLQEAYLRHAKLNGANLSGAYLNRADLSRANLSRADLSGANLSGVDLNEAYLVHAKGVTNDRVAQQAKSLRGATMPEGQTYENWVQEQGPQGG